MPTCAAFGCSNRASGKHEGLSFHQFPKDVALRDAWVSAVCRKNWTPTPSSVLCSRHFEEQHVDRSIFKFVRLRKNAVPSIFNLENPEVSVDISTSGAHSDLSNAVRNNDDPPSAAGADLSARASEQDLPSRVPSCPKIHRVLIQQFQEPVDISPSTGNLDLLSSPTCGDFILRGKPATDEETLRRKQLRRGLLCSTSLARSQKMVKTLQQSKRRLIKRVTTLKNVIKSMKDGKFTDDEHCVLRSGISEISQCLLQRQGNKASKSKMKKEYEQAVRAFAINLHNISPSAYAFVRKSFGTCLPHVKTICRWSKRQPSVEL